MAEVPEREQQIIQIHAGFIVLIARAAVDSSLKQQAEYALQKASGNEWENLARVARKIIQGKRDESLVLGLDEEDATIVKAILRGIQNPATLPDPEAKASGDQAAPGIARLIHGAATGNVEALQIVAGMAEQMSQSGGDMTLLAAQIRPMIDGERDANKICEGMTDLGQTLVVNILKELENNT
jgi:hypothetical protein